MTIKITIFSHRPHVSLARFSFCWWHHNRLLMTSQWPHNCDRIMWIVISNSLDINFIHGDIHSRLCKKDRLLYGLKPRLHYTRRDTTRRDVTRSHDWVPMKSTGPFTLCATWHDGTWLRHPNWLLYPNNRAESRSKRDSVGFRHQRNPFPRIVTRLTRLV